MPAFLSRVLFSHTSWEGVQDTGVLSAPGVSRGRSAGGCPHPSSGLAHTESLVRGREEGMVQGEGPCLGEVEA